MQYISSNNGKKIIKKEDSKYGLCNILYLTIQDMFNYPKDNVYDNVKNQLTIFNSYKLTRKHIYNTYWWNKNDKMSRLNALDYMIDYYKNNITYIKIW